MTWTLHPAAAFAEQGALWDAVNRLSGDHPLLDSAFVECLIRHFGSPRTRLAVLSDVDHPALALVEPSGAGRWQTFQPSQAPLGLVVMAAGAPAPRHVRTLMRRLPGYPLIFSVLQQDPDASSFSAAPPASLVEPLEYIRTARLTLNGTWDDYWKSRSRNLVHNLSRQRRRVGEQGGRLELTCDREPGRVAEGVREYGEIESQGWKAAGGTAITTDSRQASFYREVLERFCARGEGAIYRLLLNGQTVAVDLCLERNGILIILKTTYQEHVTGLSLGLLLHQEIFKAAFTERRLKTIEFYGPVRDWHTKWTGEIRPMYHLTFYRHSWVPRLRGLLRAGARLRWPR
jgi:hypothetical protein